MSTIEQATSAELQREQRAGQKAVSAAVLPPTAVAAPRSKTKTFTIRIANGDGDLEGSFTTRILSIGQQISVGVMRSKILSGLEVDAGTTLLAEMIAHLHHSLTERPEWAIDLLGLVDTATIQAIYAEVETHEATFRGPQKPTT